MAIVDRDATIFSSKEIAYSCYEEAFDRVVLGTYTDFAKVNQDVYTKEFNPFKRLDFYKQRYPKLTEEHLGKIAEVSFRYYLDNFRKSRFNQPIPGVIDFIKLFKEKDNLIVVLTASDSDENWFKRYDMPYDEMYSLVRLRAAKMIGVKNGKPDAIPFIIDRFSRYCDQAVTIGDHPRDHVEGILSIGAAYGLGSLESRKELREKVDIYAPAVIDLHRIFGYNGG